MAHTSTHVAARLCEAYSGIEGFFILNRSGELGYFSGDGTCLRKETLDGIPADKAIMFLDELTGSIRNSTPSMDKELGYLLAVDDAHVWQTATLVLHDHVAKALKDAFDRDITKGRMSLAQGDRKVQDISPERGLHRGFEDLLNHVGSFGMRIYFPVLYIRPPDPARAGEPDQPVRVLNMLSLLPNAGRFADILAKMRQDLEDRGALNQFSRVEHRFTLQDED